MNGIINVYKERGYTSHDVVAKLRGILKQKKIGHTGTLDPEAEGVLPVCLGKATKLCDLLAGHDKVYEAVMLLGQSTDTQDTTGTVLESAPVTASEEEVREAVLFFEGPYEQIPPMYSAIKVGGRKLYEIARAGGEVERKPRPVTIYRLECTGERDGDFVLEVECSKGTYIRTLCDDIGRALGCGACMSGLRRTRAGGFDVRDALTIEEIERRGAENCLMPVDALFAGRPVVLLKDARAEKALRNGMDVRFDADFTGECRVYAENGEFLALCRAEGGALKTIKSFFEV